MSFAVQPRIFFLNPGETLTGILQNQNASDIEERSGRSLEKLPEWNYTFQMQINPISGYLSTEKTNLSNEVSIDFFVSRGNEYRAILVDGEIAHFMALWQRARDEEKTERINNFMRKIGQGEAVRVPFWELNTQERSDRFYRSLLL
jgi:hypothetical protein